MVLIKLQIFKSMHCSAFSSYHLETVVRQTDMQPCGWYHIIPSHFVWQDEKLQTVGCGNEVYNLNLNGSDYQRISRTKEILTQIFGNPQFTYKVQSTFPIYSSILFKILKRKYHYICTNLYIYIFEIFCHSLLFILFHAVNNLLVLIGQYFQTKLIQIFRPVFIPPAKSISSKRRGRMTARETKKTAHRQGRSKYLVSDITPWIRMAQRVEKGHNSVTADDS